MLFQKRSNVNHLTYKDFEQKSNIGSLPTALIPKYLIEIIYKSIIFTYLSVLIVHIIYCPYLLKELVRALFLLFEYWSSCVFPVSRSLLELHYLYSLMCKYVFLIACKLTNISVSHIQFKYIYICVCERVRTTKIDILNCNFKNYSLILWKWPC